MEQVEKKVESAVTMTRLIEIYQERSVMLTNVDQQLQALKQQRGLLMGSVLQLSEVLEECGIDPMKISLTNLEGEAK